MEGVSDPQLSPENLRHQPDDRSSLSRSHDERHDEEISRQHLAEPIPENITLSEEVQQENQDTAFKSRLRLSSSEPCILRASNEDNQEPISENIINSEEAPIDSPGFKALLFEKLENQNRRFERMNRMADEINNFKPPWLF